MQGLFVDPAGEAPLTALYASLIGDARSFEEIALEAQLEQARGDVLARGRSGCARIHDPGELEEALARLPVYRTYVRDGVVRRRRPRGAGGGRPAGPLRRRARGVRLALSADLAAGDGEGHRGHGASTATCACWRSTTSAATPAAGACRSTSSTPRNPSARARFPRGLLVTQTHDTKRSGDARARVGALSAMARGVGVARAPLVRADRRARARTARRTATSATSSSRRSSPSGRSRPSAWRATSRRRCARPSATRTGSTRTTTGSRA